MFRTLRSHHLLASVVVFATMLALLLWNAESLLRQTLAQRVADERTTVAPLLAATFGPLLAARDYAGIDEIVRVQAGGGQIEWLEVRDTAGRRVALAGRDDPVVAASAQVVPVELVGQPMGEVRFVLSTALLERSLQELRLRGLFIGGGVFAAGAVLLLLATGWLGREFRDLTAATRRIADGDLGTRLGASRVTEIDALAGAFNRMAEALQQQLGQLQQQKDFLQGVLATLPEAWVIVDRERRIVDCNRRFAELHGLPPATGDGPPRTVGEALARVQLQRADGTPLPDAERPTQRVLDTGRPIREQLGRIRREDGGLTWVSVNASPLDPDADGRPRCALATLSDVTAHVQAEQALRGDNDRLEQRVRQRTAELERARDEAERASRAKSEFLSRMSHELRTPLNAILGFAQLLSLERARLSEADLARLGQIESAGWHLLELINDVLDLSRIEAGALRTSAEPVELNTLAAEALALVETAAAARRIRLAGPARGAAPCWARADRTRLKQVLANLLSNAVKYNRDGGEVELSVAAAGDGEVSIAVRDTGRGFSADERTRLYQPFTRFVPEGEVAEGTGIGLVITRRLVELMQGRLELETEPGEGSRFVVVLPASPPPAPPMSPAAEAAARTLPTAPQAPAAPAAPAPTHRLLYVEDNPSNVELLRQVFTLRPHWTLDVVTDGLEALTRLRDARSGTFDAAIVDIDLPGIDGVELCRRLRADPHTARLPLLALSANALPTDLRRALAAGFDAYVTKPLDVGPLLARLDALFEPGREQAGAPR